MPVATYGLYLDLTGDGDYADANEDVSAYISANKPPVIKTGFDKPYQHMARSNTLDLWLINRDGRFSPDHANALTGFRNGCAVKMTMTYQATTVTLYTGRISKIDPEPGDHGSALCEVKCDGFLTELQDGEAEVGTMENIRSDEAAVRLLHKARVYPVGFRGWFAGVEGYSNAGVSTLAETVTDFTVFNEGAHTFELLGDNWQRNTSPWKALKQVVETEFGKFYERPDGKVALWDRYRMYRDLPTAVDMAITGLEARAMQYGWGDYIVNRAVVTCRQRLIDDRETVLAEIDKRFKVRRAHRRKATEVTLAFRNVAGAKVGAKDLIPPQPYVDYTAKFVRDDTDATRQIAVQMTATSGGVKWRITNHATRPVRITTGVQRGTRITDFGELEQMASDAASIEDNRRVYEMTLQLPALEDAETAEQLAEHIITQRSTASGIPTSVTFRASGSHARMVHARDRAIGDRISVSEIQTGVSGEYFIVGIQHALMRGRGHDVTFYLEPAPPSPGWLAGTAGYSNAGTSTYAVF